MTNSTDYNEVLEYMHARFDGKVRFKSGSWLMKVINVFLKIITLGKMNNFMTGFITTIGRTVYVPDSWKPSNSRAVTLRHEMVHMVQSNTYTSVLFSILYLFVFLPGGLAYFRAKFEKEAYEESMYGAAQLQGVAVILRDEYKEHVLHHFTSAEYFWMWPFRRGLERWYEEACTRVRAKILQDVN